MPATAWQELRSTARRTHLAMRGVGSPAAPGECAVRWLALVPPTLLGHSGPASRSAGRARRRSAREGPRQNGRLGWCGDRRTAAHDSHSSAKARPVAVRECGKASRQFPSSTRRTRAVQPVPPFSSRGFQPTWLQDPPGGGEQ